MITEFPWSEEQLGKILITDLLAALSSDLSSSAVPGTKWNTELHVFARCAVTRQFLVSMEIAPFFKTKLDLCGMVAELAALCTSK